MTSKYPSVTASQKKAAAKARPKPANFPAGKPSPANDNKMGIVKSPMKIGTLPRRLLGINPIARGFNFGWELGDLLDSQFDLSGKLRAFTDGLVWTKYSNTTDWQYVPCTGCGSPSGLRHGRNQSCCITSYVLSPLVEPASPIRSTYRIFSLVSTAPVFGNPAWHYVVTGSLNPIGSWTGSRPFDKTAPVSPIPVPLAFPLELPIARPSVRPRPTEWLAPRPGEEPSSKPEEQPDPAKDPAHKKKPYPDFAAPFVLPVIPAPFFRPGRNPLPVPVVVPGTVVEVSSPPAGKPTPTSGVSIVRTPDFGSNQPPPKATLEKKAKVSSAVGIAWAGINSVTEAFDFIVAMHKSLPRDMRLSSKASKAQVIKYMMQSSPAEALKIWRHIDFAEGIENYINMQISDFAAALGSNQIKRVNQNTGMITGLDRAIRQHGEMLGDLDPESNDNWTDLVPTLDIDREAGVISITGPLGVLALRKKWLRKGK